MTARCMLALVSSCCLALPALAGANDPLPFAPDLPALRGPVDPNEVAVELLREERAVYQGPWSAPTFTTHHHHVIEVLTEGGFDAGTIRIGFLEDSELVYLDARTVSPDGQVVPVELSQVQEDRVSMRNDLEDDKDKGTRIALRHFQFPRVEVGSVLEYRYAVRNKRMSYMPSQVMAGDYPIRTYRLDIVAPTSLRFDLMVGNRAPNLKTRQDGDGVHALMELNDLPARRNEPHRPAARDHLPWWAYRVIDLKGGLKDVYQGISTWDRAATWVVWDFLTESDAHDGVPDLKHSCGGDRRCLALAAVAQARDVARFEDFANPDDARSLAAVVRSKWATSSERARLVYAMLKDAGVPVRLGLMARAHTGRIDKTFPTSAQLNHTVVAIEMPPPADKLWIDPSCEHCNAGTLPAYSLGQEAILVEVVGPQNNRDPKGEWVKITGQAAAEGAHVRDMDVTFKDGHATIVVTDTCSGEDALRTQRGETLALSQKQQQQHEEAEWQGLYPASTVNKASRYACDRERGTCTMSSTVYLPALATAVDDRLLVPLSMMWSGAGADALAASWPKRPRQSDWVVADSSIVEVDVVRLRAPAGYRFVDVPEAVAKNGPNITLNFASSLSADKKLLTVTRTLRRAQGYVPKAKVGAIHEVLQKSLRLRDVVVELVADTSAAPPAAPSAGDPVATAPADPDTSAAPPR